MKTTTINNIEFGIEGNNIYILNQPNTTEIKYTIRSNMVTLTMYYDLISVYNLEENWYKNIPVPIFVKELAPYTRDKKTKEIIRNIDKQRSMFEEEHRKDDAERDFWQSSVDLEDLKFLRLFIINNENKNNNFKSLEEVPNDLELKNVFLSKDELESIKNKINMPRDKKMFETFMPALLQAGFCFEKGKKPSFDTFLHHIVDSVLEEEVYISNGYIHYCSLEDGDQNITWSLGRFSTYYHPINGMEYNGCQTHYDSIIDYLSWFIYLCKSQKNEMEENVKYLKELGSENPKFVYVHTLGNYRGEYINIDIDELEKTFNTCKEKWLKLVN